MKSYGGPLRASETLRDSKAPQRAVGLQRSSGGRRVGAFSSGELRRPEGSGELWRPPEVR
eukprot:14890441-Alexandrium_andersonii.AAC.1